MTYLIDKLNDCTYISELAVFLPKPCKNECSESGDNYPAVKRWVKKLQLNIPRDVCIKELIESGAWDDDELEDMTDKELNIKFLWLAAGYQ